MAPHRTRPPATVEASEAHMTALAVDLAEKQLKAGTASPLVISHYLKLGAAQQQEATRNLELKNKLLEAQIANLESQTRVQDLYEQAITATRDYGGGDDV